MYQTPSPLLLSRVAECAYWAGRHLERAEGTARLIKSHSDLVMDLPKAANVGWEPLLEVLGIEGSSAEVLGGEMVGGEMPGGDRQVRSGRGINSEEVVVGFVSVHRSNPNSIRSSIAAAHSNLRVARAVMPADAVEVFTDLRNHIEATATVAVDRRSRGEWLTSVIRGCQTLSAILGESMSRDDAYCFFTVGRQLERADFTTRVLGVQAEVLGRRQSGPLEPYLDICWSAALRAMGALQPFRRSGTSNTAEATIAFLLRDTKCPRSVESCLIEASRWLLEIPGHADAMAAIASTQSRLQEVDATGSVDGWLHDFVDQLQVGIADIHDNIESRWFAPVAVNVAG